MHTCLKEFESRNSLKQMLCTNYFESILQFKMYIYSLYITQPIKHLSNNIKLILTITESKNKVLNHYIE